MAVYRGSRYSDIEYTEVEFAEGDFRPFFALRKHVKKEDIGRSFSTHFTSESDELDLITFIAGGPTRLWWIVADINDVVSPLDLETSKELTVPTSNYFLRK